MFDQDLEWLRAISPELAIAVTVLDEQHVRRAAERLAMPQPTVSTVMRRLAEAIGAPLVQPSGRGIVATEAGRAFLPAARQALNQLRAARQDLQEVIDPDRGRIALGFVHSRGPRDVPRLLGAFLSAYPDIAFTLKQGGAPAMLDQLRAGDLDVVIVAPCPPTDSQLESLVLGEEQLYLTVASDHHLATQTSVDLREAATETFVGLTAQHSLRHVFDSLCQQAGFVPQLALEGEEHETLRGLVQAGLGVAVLPRATHHYPGLVEIALRDPTARRQVGAVWHKGRRLAPAARRFLTFLTTSGTKVLQGG
ncbi:LysR family transcriptional regulator [Mycobacterium decipiens]|uniref:LysR family transcriptional regulator n=1 Tax=Mycobacterium decipiens TaxID=1430326 RepID=UPI0013FE3B89|nr:LysR family transcriptional regulator [Mycobacterium decipiens]